MSSYSITFLRFGLCCGGCKCTGRGSSAFGGRGGIGWSALGGRGGCPFCTTVLEGGRGGIGLGDLIPPRVSSFRGKAGTNFCCKFCDDRLPGMGMGGLEAIPGAEDSPRTSPDSLGGSGGIVRLGGGVSSLGGNGGSSRSDIPEDFFR